MALRDEPPPFDLPVTWHPYYDQPWIWFRRKRQRPVAVQLIQRPPRLALYSLYGLLLAQAGVILVADGGALMAGWPPLAINR